MSKYYFCTRPSLAMDLATRGFTGEPVQNIWHPERPAWRFPMSREMCEAVQAFFIGRGLEVPGIVTDYLAADLEDDNQQGA